MAQLEVIGVFGKVLQCYPLFHRYQPMVIISVAKCSAAYTLLAAAKFYGLETMI
jgi:hypothetical protein